MAWPNAAVTNYVWLRSFTFEVRTLPGAPAACLPCAAICSWFITKVVLAEVAATIDTDAQPDTIPFFRNDDEANLVRHLDGKDPLESPG